MKTKKGKILLAVLSIVILIAVIGFFVMKNVVSKANAVQIENVDISTIPDGAYQGEYKVSPVRVVVEVTVKNGAIEQIFLVEHDNGLGKKAEEITDRVISEQSLEVDAVTSATVSSKTILKAIEDALLNHE